METVAPLGLVIGTIGVAYLTHGFLGKMVRGEWHSILLIVGSSILAALATILSSNISPLIVLTFGVLYEVIVEGFWREAIFRTSSSRDFIKTYMVLGYPIGTLLFTLVLIFSAWRERKFTNFASEMRSDFISAAVLWAFWILSLGRAFIMKRLMLRMPELLVWVVGAALVLIGIACIIAPSIMPLLKTA